MRSIQLLSFFIVVLFAAGCNQKTGEMKPGSPASEEKKTSNVAADTVGGHDYTFLTYKMLLYKNSVSMGKDASEQPYKGQWIKLDPDGTYRAGKYEKQTHTGKWFYNHNAGMIQLHPDDESMKPTEWKVLYNDDMVVFVGTGTYDNNSGTQIQLIRIDKYPVEQ